MTVSDSGTGAIVATDTTATDGSYSIDVSSDIYRSMGANHSIARCRLILDREAAAERNDGAAPDHFEAALEIFEDVGAPRGPCECSNASST